MPKADFNPERGYWPNWREKLRNDFRTYEAAESNDGLIGPIFDPPAWIDGPGVATPETVETARRLHEQALARIDSAESRATRLIQTDLALLTLTLTVAGFLLNRLRSVDADPWIWMVVLPLGACSLLCLTLSALQAIGVDRVGMVEHAQPEPLASLSTEKERMKSLVLQEVQGARLANWTAKNKLKEFLQARAWLTRGVLALLCTSVCALIIWTYLEPVQEDDVSDSSTRDPGECTHPSPARQI